MNEPRPGAEPGTDMEQPEPRPGEAPEPGPQQPDPQPADEGPQPLGLRVEPTGHEPVDAQLRRLQDADHLAVSGHLEVYEDVHRGLRDTLTALDRHDPRS